MKQKTHRNNGHMSQRREVEDENLKLCQSFKVRPPLFFVPQVTINQHFDRFKIKLKNVTVGAIEIKIKSLNTGCFQQEQKKNKKSKKINKEKQKLQGLIQISSDNEMEQMQERIPKIKRVSFGKLSNSNNKQNLASYSLHEIIYLLYSQDLMLQYYYKIFDANFIIDEEKSFQMLRRQEQQHDFSKTLFSFVDHRIFAEILVISFGSKYEIRQNLNTKQDGVLTKLYTQIYAKQLQDYLDEWDIFNKVHKRHWMPTSSYLLTNVDYFTKIYSKIN